MEQPRALTSAELHGLRELVAAERERTASRLEALARQFDDIVEASADAVRDDEHDPEGATIAFERAQVAALQAEAHAQLVALDAADVRLAAPDAGRCGACGGAIGYERLRARPAATTCVACADGRRRRTRRSAPPPA